MIHRLLGEWKREGDEVAASTVCGQDLSFPTVASALRYVSRWPLLVDCPSCREAE